MPLPVNQLLAIGGASSIGAYLVGRGGLFGRRTTAFEPGAPGSQFGMPATDAAGGGSSFGGLSTAAGAGGGGFDPTHLVPGLDAALAGAMGGGADNQSAGTYQTADGRTWVLDSGGLIGGLQPDSFEAIASEFGGPIGVTRTDSQSLPYVQIGSGSPESILHPSPGVVYGPSGSAVGFVDNSGSITGGNPSDTASFYSAVASTQSAADQQAFYAAVARQLGQPAPTAPAPAAPAPAAPPAHVHYGWPGS